ncbi:major facilitator superfamily transporter [Aspergillus luchuensis]|uniref:Major facilitator superfamily transporter n=1 Tax=Aspergillus kawachii TaxID=1069201 RepID=A0A146FRK6_ASPKA|nr:major facilitator superfamily transporter [Aspergillus luchuensis]
MELPKKTLLHWVRPKAKEMVQFAASRCVSSSLLSTALIWKRSLLTGAVMIDHDIPPENPTGVPSEEIRVAQWEDYDSHLNPRNYSPWRKSAMTALVSLIGLSCTAASAIDSADVSQYSEYFGVSTVVGSLTTGGSSWSK